MQLVLEKLYKEARAEQSMCPFQAVHRTSGRRQHTMNKLMNPPHSPWRVLLLILHCLGVARREVLCKQIHSTTRYQKDHISVHAECEIDWSVPSSPSMRNPKCSRIQNVRRPVKALIRALPLNVDLPSAETKYTFTNFSTIIASR